MLPLSRLLSGGILLDHSGQVVGSFASAVEPDDPALVKAVEALLEAKPPT